MDWPVILIIILGSLVALMLTGMPIAFCFIFINIIAVFLWWGGTSGLGQFILNTAKSITIFGLIPVPLFILMGVVMMESGMSTRIIDTLDKWFGRIPGRLSLEAVGAGALFSVLSGESLASVAMLGSTLVPEMEKRGYKKSMSLGPILGAGGLASMIPPSGTAVLLGAIGRFSVGRLLIAIIFPGMMLAAFFVIYIFIRCFLQPSIAPRYTVSLPPISTRILDTIRYVLPLGIIVFLVVGIIFLGIATPSEAAATGAVGTFIVAALYRRLTWDMVKRSVTATVEISTMCFMIAIGAITFSNVLAYSGAIGGLAEFALSLPVTPILIIAGMQVVLLIMGMFMEAIAMMMIALPLFMPVVRALGFSPVWFGVLFLINIEVAMLSPPFGMGLFVMKGVAPPDTTMGDIFRAALPFVVMDLLVILLIMVFPDIALWLSGAMRG